MKRILHLLVLIALLASPAVAAELHKLDKSHSETTFTVRHLISTVTGRFRDFDAVINFDKANPEASSVEFTINSASIDTANDKRDGHLRSGDFFDVEKNPNITFRSTAIKATGKNRFNVAGDLTMRGVTRKVVIPVTYLGSIKDPGGREKHGFELSTTLDRKDYGIVWNKTLDTGGTLLSDEVDVRVNLQTVVAQ